LVTFKAISNFTTSLEEVFGKEERPLKLYVHLISKTTLAHEKAIQKHIEAFRTFCISNREAFEQKNISKLVQTKISYSERVYIDISKIFSRADKDTTDVIWKHLLTISALVDPTGKARQILKETARKGTGPAKEANFLNDIIDKVEKHVDPNANPMEAVSSIMNSGIFTELVGGMGNGLQDGSLDLGKLMGTVQNMVSSLSGSAGGASEKESDNPMDLITTMMGSINAGANSDNMGGLPDLSGMMNMVGPMLGALSSTGGGSSSGGVEAEIEAQVAKARKKGVLPTIKE
jgi:hypothetical protein